MTSEQLRDSGVKPGWKAVIVKEWQDGSLENSCGKMDKWLGKTMTVKEVCDGRLYMEEDIGCRKYEPSIGWCWYAPSIERVFQPVANGSNDSVFETASSDELNRLLFG